MRILTVDDDKVVQRYLAGLLSPRGQVDQAPDGAQAVDMVTRALNEDNPYDLVVMDVMMPAMDGLEATRTIVELLEGRAVPPEKRARVVMLTCLSDPQHMIEAQYQCGADAYLTKPLEPETLWEVLASLGLADSSLSRESL